MLLSAFFAARPCFCLFFVADRDPPPRERSGLLVLGSVSGVSLQFLVQFAGLRWTTVSHASLMVGTLPMLLALSSALFLHERFNLVESGALLLELGIGSSARFPRGSLSKPWSR